MNKMKFIVMVYGMYVHVENDHIIKQSMLPKDIDIFVVTPSQLYRVYPSFSLHSILDAILSFCFSICKIKRSQTLRMRALRIVRQLYVVSLLGSWRSLAGLEIHRSNRTFAQVPMLDSRYLMH